MNVSLTTVGAFSAYERVLYQPSQTLPAAGDLDSDCRTLVKFHFSLTLVLAFPHSRFEKPAHVRKFFDP